MFLREYPFSNGAKSYESWVLSLWLDDVLCDIVLVHLTSVHYTIKRPLIDVVVMW